MTPTYVILLFLFGLDLAYILFFQALVTNLNLKMVRTFGIQTVSVHGKGSSVRQVNFTLPHSDVSQSGMSDASLSDSAREPSTDASSVMGERPKQRMVRQHLSYFILKGWQVHSFIAI